MKKAFILTLLIIGLSLITQTLTSCGESEPQVTYMEEYDVSSAGGDLSFRGSTKYYKLYDKNRLCQNKDYCFVVTKTNQIINSADRCDRCGHSWYVHDEK